MRRIPLFEVTEGGWIPSISGASRAIIIIIRVVVGVFVVIVV